MTVNSVAFGRENENDNLNDLFQSLVWTLFRLTKLLTPNYPVVNHND